jgi:predicted metalloprotease
LTLTHLDQAIAGFLELRDGIGVDALDPQAHGTGFDRIGAFQEGFAQGAARCADYPEMFEWGDLVVVEVPFTDPEDFERGGDLPLEEVIPLAKADLDDFWTVLFQEMGESYEPVADVVVLDAAVDDVACGGTTYSGEELRGASFYCTVDDIIYIEGQSVVVPLYEIGDFAVATELARLYALAAQFRLGDDRDSLEANLQVDCYAGLYAASGFLANRPNQELVLSPGDLDEAVIAFLRTSDPGTVVESGTPSVGTAFQRFEAFREGFMGGLPAFEVFSE